MAIEHIKVQLVHITECEECSEPATYYYGAKGEYYCRTHNQFRGQKIELRKVALLEPNSVYLDQFDTPLQGNARDEKQISPGW